MDKNKFKTLVLTLLTTIAEVGDRGTPSGHMYAAVMSQYTLSEYEAALNVLIDAKWAIKEPSHLIVPTPKGVEMGKKVSALLKV
jgi:hypothetical protein